jgi:hypothetical protein
MSLWLLLHSRSLLSHFSARNHFGGYYYGDEYIRLFSHTHMVGSGVLDYGNIGVMPITKNPTLLLVLIALHEWRTHTRKEKTHTQLFISAQLSNYAYRSQFSHQSEGRDRPSRAVASLTPTLDRS